MSVILGLNAFHADASAALFVNGELRMAIEEERLSRVKHAAGFPTLAIRRCLADNRIAASEIEHVAISRDPRANLARKLLYVARGGASPGTLLSRIANARKVRKFEDHLQEALGIRSSARIHHVEHHRAHLASAFFASPFEDAAVLSIDGFGDFVSTMWAHGRDRSIEILGTVGYPHSVGVLYTAVTQWLGFPHYGDEGKVMGLAPYGKPRFVDQLRQACRPTDKGFELNLDWFVHASGGVEMSWQSGAPVLGPLYSKRFIEAFGPVRQKGEPLADLHHDVAASLQALTEEIVIHVANLVHKRTGSPRLCLAGGVALNSVANGKLRANTPFREIFVQPAAGDNGTSLGAALHVEHAIHGNPRRFIMNHAYTGPEFDDAACEAAIAKTGSAVAWQAERLDESARVEAGALALDQGKVVGWFQGRMEFGPRALGHRSVLADPRRADMKQILNQRIKHREAFRPFAPAVLAERASEWFEDAQPSPAMLMVLPFRAERRAQVPAVAHVDGSGRLQTVEKTHAPLFYALIAAFERRTGVPIVLNTSFNENEPIVCTPDEAVACFARTGIDELFLGGWHLRRQVT